MAAVRDHFLFCVREGICEAWQEDGEELGRIMEYEQMQQLVFALSFREEFARFDVSRVS